MVEDGAVGRDKLPGLKDTSTLRNTELAPLCVRVMPVGEMSHDFIA